MFTSKKDAEAYDKMLELGEYFAALLDSQIPGIDPQQAETFGILLAKNKEIVIEACKGNPEVLTQISQGETPMASNVTPLLAEANA